MSAANITIPRLGSTRSSAMDRSPGTTAAGTASLRQVLRSALRIVTVEWSAAHQGRTAPPSSVGHKARR